MFTPINGADSPMMPTDFSISLDDPAKEALSYLQSEVSLEPVLKFIEGAVAKESIRSREIHFVDVGDKMLTIELLNFTDMEVKAEPSDIEPFIGPMKRAYKAMLTCGIEDTRVQLDQFPEEGRGEFEEQLASLEAVMPVLVEEDIYEALASESENPDSVDLVVEGGLSRLVLTRARDMRIAIFPSPPAVQGERAQAHYYVLISDNGGFDRSVLLAVPKRQNSEELSDEDLVAMVRSSKDSIGANDLEPIMSLMRRLGPGTDWALLMDGPIQDESFLKIAEAFGQTS